MHLNAQRQFLPFFVGRDDALKLHFTGCTTPFKAPELEVHHGVPIHVEVSGNVVAAPSVYNVYNYIY